MRKRRRGGASLAPGGFLGRSALFIDWVFCAGKRSRDQEEGRGEEKKGERGGEQPFVSVCCETFPRLAVAIRSCDADPAEVRKGEGRKREKGKKGKASNGARDRKTASKPLRTWFRIGYRIGDLSRKNKKREGKERGKRKKEKERAPLSSRAHINPPQGRRLLSMSVIVPV